MWAIGRRKKVHPASSSSTTRTTKKDFVRFNGFSRPFHPLQILAWVFMIFFSISYFALMVPRLPSLETRIIAGVINGIVFLSHVVIHIVSIYSNPADDSVIQRFRQQKKQDVKGKVKANLFDRSQHEHVIENQFCYICEVLVSPKSKHCSVCNKCVANFDHHCKWLNNCVGGKNYR